MRADCARVCSPVGERWEGGWWEHHQDGGGAARLWLQGDSGGLGTRVKWGLVGKIGLSWLLTLPFAGGIAAAITAAVRPSLKS